MAKVKWQVVGYSGGIESTLEGFGMFYMVIGLLGAIIFTIVFLNGNPLLYLEFALVSLLSAFFPFAVLKGLAELLRVQKKASNLLYAGTLDLPSSEVKESHCDSCDAIVPRYGQPTCDNCKQPLQWPKSAV